MRLSPDEKQLAVSRLDLQAGSADIWLVDLARNTPSRFTFDPGNDTAPVWSPDRSYIVFASNRTGVSALYKRPANGTGNDEQLFKSTEPAGPHDWSPDGKFLLYGVLSPTTAADLWILPFTGEQKPVPYIQTQFNEAQAQFSPDGRWVAYASNESGVFQVYVQTFPTSGGKWQVSTNGGAQPQWRQDGKELFFLGPDRKLMLVKVDGTGPTFIAAVPQPLFDTRTSPIFPGGFSASYYAVSGDGQRFIVNTLVGDSAATPLTVVLNWSAGVKK